MYLKWAVIQRWLSHLPRYQQTATEMGCLISGKNRKDGMEDADGDGYTNVEEFLNGTNPQEKINYRNLGNNIDSIS
jgi:hypothetical protein